ELEIIDLHLMEEQEKEKKAREIYIAGANHAFNLENGPLFLFKIIRLEINKFILVYNVHHIVNDGWSQGIINNEVLTFYNRFEKGKGNPFTTLKLQYKDYSAWHNRLIATERFGTAGQYWLNKFRDKPNGIQLPTDSSRSAIQTFNGGRVAQFIDEEQTNRLNRLNLENEATLFMGLLCMFNIYLHKLSGDKDIIVGAPIAGRKKTELHGMVGFLVNTLVYRNRV
ncbi:MAG: hypothetical protein GY757_44830, partial [bacterium]|nr:hypothetical protein [bacterium]